MRFAQFMASGAGRGPRVAAGSFAIVAGIAVFAVKGSVILGVVLVSVGALFAVVGSINVCPLTPIFGGPFNGRKVNPS